MKYLLDTNIVSYIFRGDEPIVKKLGTLDDEDVNVSVITCAEIAYGIYNTYGKRQMILRDKLQFLIDNVNILYFDLDCAEEYGRIKKLTRSKGRSLSDLDIQIAATAIVNNMVLVTNDKDFGSLSNLVVENWTK